MVMNQVKGNNQLANRWENPIKKLWINFIYLIANLEWFHCIT